jgi:predicted acyltransferase
MNDAAPDPGRGTARARLPAVDRFRGLAIMMMIVANFLEYVRWIPPWLKHAPDIGLTVVDLVMPFFVFAMGLTFGASVRRRLGREGGLKTGEHVVTRAMALIGIGTLFTLGEIGYGFNPHASVWGVLQALGASILLCYPALFLPTWGRLAAALAVMGAYQWALDAYWLDRVLASQVAGLRGAISWAALLMLSTVFADLALEKRWKRYVGLAALSLAAGLALASLFPISKHRMSCTFDLTVCGIAALAFAAFEALAERRSPLFSVLEIWGRNPLVLYVLHLLLLSVFLLPSAPWWHADAALWLLLLELAALGGVLHLVAWSLDRKRVTISL